MQTSFAAFLKSFTAASGGLVVYRADIFYRQSSEEQAQRRMHAPQSAPPNDLR